MTKQPVSKSDGIGLWSFNSTDEMFVFDGQSRELLGRSNLHFSQFLSICHPDDRLVFSATFNKLKLGAEPFCITFRVHIDGDYARITMSGETMRQVLFGYINIAGQEEYISAGFLDELREMNGKMQEVENEHTALSGFVDSAPVGFMAVSGREVRYISRSAELLSGLTLDSKLDDYTAELFNTGADARSWKSAKFKSPDGEYDSVLLYAYRGEYKGTDAVMAWVAEPDSGIGSDGEAHLARSIADRNQKAKSEYIAEMSHEVRTPMNAIIGLTNLLEYTELTERQADYVTKTRQAAHALFRTVNNILDFSKIGLSKLELSQVSFKLNDVLMDLQTVISTRAAEKNLKYVTDCRADIERELTGDPIRLNQILLNLLDNAIQYTKTGSVTLEIDETGTDDGKTVIRFTVTDTGTGMSQSQIKTLFDPVETEGGMVSRKYGGGISLMICKNLVGLMNGDIGCESTVGEGSKFFFTAEFDLPEAKKEQPAGVPDDAVSETYDDSDIEKNEEIAILVVEDVDINRIIVNEHLIVRGYKPDFVVNGKDALDIISIKKYDIVFMDIRMPVMDGLTATREIRKTKSAEELPIIAMTAHARAGDKETSLKAGMNSYITKPIEAELVYKAIRQWVKK